jgi:hypothetical protein
MRPKARARRIVLLTCIAGAALLVFAIFSGVRSARRSDVGRTAPLPDGGTLTLRQVSFVSKSFTYTHQSGNRFLRFIAPALPSGLRNKLNFSGGSMSFGGSSDTNLYLITVERPKKGANPPTEPIGRVRIVDEQSNAFDACWGASTLGMEGETVRCWQVQSFPRRSPSLHVQFMAIKTDGDWAKAAEFEIPNPAFATYPQWTAQPMPVTSKDGDLAVTLREFRSGEKMLGRRGQGDEAIVARRTHLLFTFAEKGAASDDWRIQKLTIADATGNHWSPYLDFINQDFTWTTNGTVEFFGALWPGENAWKLNLEVVRGKGFQLAEFWEIEVPMPRRGTLLSLTNEWQSDGQKVELVGFAAPNRDFTGDFKWVAKWWGEDRNKVYSLAVKIGPDVSGHRLAFVRAVDQNGAEVKLMQHGSQDSDRQAMFLEPSDDAESVKLTLALQRSRFLQFLAKPQTSQ